MQIQEYEKPYWIGPSVTVDSDGRGVKDRSDDCPVPVNPPDAHHPLTTAQFGDAFHRYYPITLRFLLTRGVSFDLAEEVTQTAWTKAWQFRSQLQKPHMISSWVISVAMNVLRNQKRHEQYLRTLDDRSSRERWEPTYIDADIAERVLASCSDSDKHILYSAYAEGHTSQQLGEQLGISPVYVRVRLMRLRRSLRAQFSTLLR